MCKGARQTVTHPSASENPLWSLSPQETTEAVVWLASAGTWRHEAQGRAQDGPRDTRWWSWAQQKHTSFMAHESHGEDMNWAASYAKLKGTSYLQGPGLTNKQECPCFPSSPCHFQFEQELSGTLVIPLLTPNTTEPVVSLAYNCWYSASSTVTAKEI